MKEILFFGGFIFEPGDAAGMHLTNEDFGSEMIFEKGARFMQRHFFSGMINLELKTGLIQNAVFEKAQIQGVSLKKNGALFELSFSENGGRELSPLHQFFCAVPPDQALPAVAVWVGKYDFIERRFTSVLQTTIVDSELKSFDFASTRYNSFNIKEFSGW